MDEMDTVEDVKPSQHFYLHDTDSKMSSIPKLVDLPMKTGEIFRNNNGEYSFMCFNCALIFEDFGEIINHCETHYEDEKKNITDFVLCAETRSEQLETLIFPSITESKEPTIAPNESMSSAKTSQVSVRRRKRSTHSRPTLDFPQYCPQCGVWCENFTVHMKNEHSMDGGIYQCFICKDCFENLQTLKLHLSNVHATTNSCYSCAMEPPVKSPLEARRHKCLFCKEWYKNHAEFKVHFKEVHDKNADSFFARRKNCNIFTCYVCEKEFPLRYYLTAHMKIHYDKFLQHICPTCGRRFRTYGLVTQHLKTHEGKIYQCDQCDKQFPHKVRLNRHMKCHETERKYKCDHCPKTFTQKKYVSVHRAVHMQTSQKKYPCKFCSASFNFTSGRRAHEKSQHNAL